MIVPRRTRKNTETLFRNLPGFVSLGLYAVALGVHILTTDFGLWLHHKDRYNRHARWVLIGAVLTGWVMGITVTLPKASIGLISAFVAGVAFYTIVIFVA